VGLVTEQVVERNDPHGGQGLVWVRDMAPVGVKHKMAEVKLLCYSVKGGCLLSLSLCRRGFQDLLKVRASSLLMLCGCISSSTASLMSRSMYPVLAMVRDTPMSRVIIS
jgi:hypothetical protein